MKSVLSTLIMMAMVCSALAQMPVGYWYTGACLRMAFNSHNDGDSKSSEFIINPATFYTLDSKWGVGGGIWYNSDNDRTGEDQKTVTSALGFSPGVRYYGRISDKVNCYAQGAVNLGWGSTRDEYFGSETKTSNSYYGVRLNPGIMWNISKRSYIDFSYGSLSYLNSTYKNKDTDSQYSDSSFELDLNTWSLGVAFYYLFSCGDDAEELY